MKNVVAGIDIGGTNTAIGITDKRGRILADTSISTRGHDTPENFVKKLYQAVSGVLKKDFTLKGIGIGVPNGDYFNGVVLHAPNLEWKGVVHLEAMMHKASGVPVKITNDANAGALGEKIFGGAKELDDFAFITLGTGLGSGFVTRGELVYGHDSFAGEMGHVTVKENGRLCACGKRGCLETYVSATGICRTASELLGDYNGQSILQDVPYSGLSSKVIYDAAMKGDPLALEAFDQTAKILGKALSNMVTILSPKAIFLFGGLAKAGDMLLKPVKRYMEENIMYVYKNKVDVLLSHLPEGHAAVLGAAALIRHELDE